MANFALSFSAAAATFAAVDVVGFFVFNFVYVCVGLHCLALELNDCI